MIMVDKSMASKGNSLYKASLTREQFLFYEMRTTAKLLNDGLSDDEIVKRIMEENLFQYPTEKSVKRMANLCIRRLKLLNDNELVGAIATQPSDISKQVCLYAMMKQSHLVWDFMITVVGEKYRLKDSAFGKIDLNVFFMRLQEQDDVVATWSETTITKIKQVLMKILIENDYLDNSKTDHINPVWITPILENAIRESGDTAALSAFNCFD